MSPPATNAFIACHAVWGVYWLISVIAFHSQRNQPFIRKRHPGVMAVNQVSSLVLMGSWFSYVSAFKYHVPYSYRINNLLMYIFGSLFVTSLFMRSGLLLFAYYTNKTSLVTAVHARAAYEEADWFEKLMWHIVRQKNGQSRSRRSLPQTRLQRCTRALGMVFKPFTTRPATTVFAVVAIAYFCAWLKIIYKTGYPDNVYNPAGDDRESFPLEALLGVYLIAAPLSFSILRRVKDSFYIQLETLVGIVLFVVLVALYLVDTYMPTLNLSLGMGPIVFILLAAFGTHTVYCTTPAFYCLYVRWHGRHSVPEGPEGLQKVLMTPVLFAEFQKLLAKELSIENAHFWEDYVELLDATNIGMEPPEFYTDAILHIYETYIVVGARFELNISSKIRKAVRAKVDAGGPLHISVLEDVREEVFNMMLNNTYPRYSQSRRNSKASTTRVRNSA
ncbi:Regulator of G-protein signaling 7 [Sorochytrium milnesiophthora]